jgi:phenylacetaldehyde dehydrogenase
LVLGAGLDPASTVGPLSSSAQRDRVEAYVRGAVDTGARIAFGGNRPGSRPEGYFFEPTAIVGCSDSDAIVTEEVFGPVVTVQPFDTDEELIERLGTIRHGLTAGVWTRDLTRAHTVAAAMPAGTTWVNTYGDFSATAPWGGVNDSGLGRDCGPEGLEAFLQTRTTWVSLG